MTATPRQLANPSAPGTATSVPTRGARPPGSRAGSAESSLPGTNGAPGAREEGGAQTRNREPSAAGTPPKGRGNSRTSQDKSRLGKSPPPPFLRGEYTQKVHVMEWRGIRARRLPAGHPAPTLTRGAGHGSRGSLAGRLSSLGRAREGDCRTTREGAKGKARLPPRCCLRHPTPHLTYGNTPESSAPGNPSTSQPPPTPEPGPDPGKREAASGEGWGRCTWSREMKSRFFFFFSFSFLSFFFLVVVVVV